MWEKTKAVPSKSAQNQKVQYGMPGFATPSRRLRFGLPSRQLRHWIHCVEPVHVFGPGHCSHLARAMGDGDGLMMMVMMMMMMMMMIITNEYLMMNNEAATSMNHGQHMKQLT